jgi:hypothetical protein
MFCRHLEPVFLVVIDIIPGAIRKAVYEKSPFLFAIQDDRSVASGLSLTGPSNQLLEHAAPRSASI